MKTLSFAALMGMVLLFPATASAQAQHRPPAGHPPPSKIERFGHSHPVFVTKGYCGPGRTWQRVCVQWGHSPSGPFRACVRYRWRCAPPPAQPR
jgi:hypothetical protein